MSKSIWDTIKTSDRQPGDQPKSDGEFFTIHFAVEKRSIRCASDMTLERALKENASRLGYDGQRAVTWRDGKGVVSASTVGQPGVAYTAAVSLETKGL